MARLSLHGVHKRFGEVEVIRGIDLEIEDGEFLVLVGPSGCGKSTLLRLIAGLEDLNEGELRIDGRRANELRPADRGAAMVFQSYALYPHMTVAENMGFALKMAGVGRAEREARVQAAAASLQLTELLPRYPRALSGGQRQRVAIGRAIVRQPGVFLFDEPLSNLDAALRVNLRIELARLHQTLGATMIYVTHDQVEAMTLGTRIAVLDGGRIAQVGAPLDLYRAPADTFVAGFLGSPRINLLPRPGPDAPAPHRRLWDLSLVGHSQAAPSQVGLRPEHLRPASDGSGVPGTVVLAEHLGDASVIHLEVEGLAEPLRVKLGPGHAALQTGQPLSVCPEEAAAIRFDTDDRRMD